PTLRSSDLPRLVGPCLCKKIIDLGQNLTHLVRCRFARSAHLSGQMNHAVIDHAVMDASVEVEPLYVGHRCCLLFSLPASAEWGCPAGIGRMAPARASRRRREASRR